MIEKREYDRRTYGCIKGISLCDHEFKKQIKLARNQFKNGNSLFIDESGKMKKPPNCQECSRARNFQKTCEIQYENNFYGYAKECESGKTIYLHWSNQFFPNCGTSKVVQEGEQVSLGVPDKKSYEDLFRLTSKNDNQKVSTPKVDEFISGFIEENKNGPYKGRLQWVKWFRHSLTFYNWTKLVKTTLHNRAMQNLISQPKMMIAKMIYDQNKLLPEMDDVPKTPCNCEPISHEHWIIAALTMVAFLGIRPKNRNALDAYGGISRVGKMDYFTFLENIDKPDDLYVLSSTEVEILPLSPLRMHDLNVSAAINDDIFWSDVSNTFKNLPFARCEQRSLGNWKKRHIDYNNFRDNFSIEYRPYHNPAPYYNSAHAYDPRRYYPSGQMLQYSSEYPQQNIYSPYHSQSIFLDDYVNYPFSRKRSNSEREHDRHEPHFRRHGNCRAPKTFCDEDRSSRTAHREDRYREDLREIIIADINREFQRQRNTENMKKKKRQMKSRHRDSSVDSLPKDRGRSTERRDPVRCRDDSGRGDNRRKVNPRSDPRSESCSTNSSFDSQQNEATQPTYDELLRKIERIEREKKELEEGREQKTTIPSKNRLRSSNRWKTESSDSE